MSERVVCPCIVCADATADAASNAGLQLIAHIDLFLKPIPDCACRYAIALEVEKASVTNAIYVDGGDPCHSVRVVEGGSPSGQDLLIVSGEEHDQGIKPEKYSDSYGR